MKDTKPVRRSKKAPKKRANNEGSVYARKDKHGHIVSYRGVLTVGWKAGRQVRQSFTAVTKEEVRELMNRAIVGRQDAILPPVSTLTVASFLDRWMQHKAGEVRRSTMQSYRGIV